jgi:hypothetical protein
LTEEEVASMELIIAGTENIFSEDDGEEEEEEEDELDDWE